METLAEMFGQGCVKPLIKGEKLTMLVDDKTIVVDLATLVSLEFIKLYDCFITNYRLFEITQPPSPAIFYILHT